MRVVLIGCGRWGANILRDLRDIGVEVVVVDTDDQTRSLAIRGGAVAAVPAWPDKNHSPDSVQAFVVATPASTHFEVINSLADFGVPVFSEKPLTTDLQQARLLIDRLGDRLFELHVWRYHPGVRAIKEIIRSGELGPLIHLRTIRSNWTSPRTDVDCIWTLMPHDLSIAIELLDTIPPICSSSAVISDGSVVGMVSVLGSRPLVQIEVSTRSPDKIREIHAGFRDGVVSLLSDRSKTIRIARIDRLRTDTQLIEHRNLHTDEPLKLQMQSVVDWLRGGVSPTSSGRDSLLVIQRIVEMRQMAGLC